ncbi:A24 family peptidase [Parvibaculum sedimenti]|uniref:A24 family peptidase n=1 Tax=Parvibaculum sedimenti TaxID=2608632 RepID=UPI001639BE02|nr:prepilin peptidase [Parvibaculum sedimenti]
MTTSAIALWGVAFSAVLAGVARDLQDRIIPNALVLIVCAAGVAMQCVGEGWNVWHSLSVTTAVYLCAAALAYWGFMGGGDAKLIVASTLLVPPGQVVALLLSIALAGGLLSCFYLAAQLVLKRRRLATPVKDAGVRRGGRISNLIRTEAERILAGEPMPYAIAILGGLAFHFFVEVI